MELQALIQKQPLVGPVSEYKEIFWGNPDYGKEAELPFDQRDIDDAEARLARFAPYIKKAFPETAPSGGIIESDLKEIPEMGRTMGVDGRLFLKCDSHLPVSGSIKARGGIYEILKLA